MMHLVDALARHPGPTNLKQLAAETRLHPSTAHRILAVMVDSRLVDRIEPGTYRLGIRLLELGNLVRVRLNVRQEALPYMRRLHDELQETVNLSVRQGDEVIYVERVSSSGSMMRGSGSRTHRSAPVLNTVAGYGPGSRPVRSSGSRSPTPRHLSTASSGPLAEMVCD